MAATATTDHDELLEGCEDVVTCRDGHSDVRLLLLLLVFVQLLLPLCRQRQRRQRDCDADHDVLR